MVQLFQASAFQMPLSDESVQMVVTSPPYWGLRTYQGEQGTEPYGQEETSDAYVEKTMSVLQEIRRVIKPNGLVFWNIGDSCSVGGFSLVPQKVAIAAQKDSWIIVSDVIWAKTNPMPESVKKRPTKSYEHILILAKSKNYYWNTHALDEAVLPSSIERNKYAAAPSNSNEMAVSRSRKAGSLIREDGKRNVRDVWSFATHRARWPKDMQHFAVFPEELPKKCILAGSTEGDTVLDPFCGSGTTGRASVELKRNFIGVDVAYQELARQRIEEAQTKTHFGQHEGCWQCQTPKKDL